MTITIEQIEELANSLETTDTEQRANLQRMIRAEARILAVREPDKFTRKALEYRDEDGHWDNSYPPKQKYRNYTGPRLLKVQSCTTDDIATTSGFYYDWKRVTTDPGIYVACDGELWGCNESGTGSLGRFAAHPGDCNVEVELEWSPLDMHEVTIVQLQQVEEHLRKLAFPLSHAETE